MCAVAARTSISPGTTSPTQRSGCRTSSVTCRTAAVRSPQDLPRSPRTTPIAVQLRQPPRRLRIPWPALGHGWVRSKTQEYRHRQLLKPPPLLVRNDACAFMVPRALQYVPVTDEHYIYVALAQSVKHPLMGRGRARTLVARRVWIWRDQFDMIVLSHQLDPFRDIIHIIRCPSTRIRCASGRCCLQARRPACLDWYVSHLF